MANKMSISAVLIGVVFAALALTVSAEEQIRVFLDGKEIVYEVPPRIISAHTMVPLRATIETITGSQMDWSAENKEVSFIVDSRKFTHKIGERVIYVDGRPLEFDTPSVIIESNTLVPIRMIAETSGCGVEWDASNRFVMITGKKPAGVAINSISAGGSSIRKGEAVELTVMTTGSAMNVRAGYDGGETKYAELMANNAAEKMWKVKCLPSATQGISIYAEGVNAGDSAAATQYIEVIDGAEAESSPVPSAIKDSSPSILSITQKREKDASRDDDYEYICLYVRTTKGVEYVWLDYDDPIHSVYDYGSFVGTAENGEKEWEIICSLNSRNLRVCAGTEKPRSSLTYESRAVYIDDGFQPIISADKTSIARGERVTLSIRTFRINKEDYPFVQGIYNDENVWVEYRGENGLQKTNAALRPEDKGKGTKNWTVEIYPSETQIVRIGMPFSMDMMYINPPYIYETDRVTGPPSIYELEINVASKPSKPEIISFGRSPGASENNGNVELSKGSEFTFFVTTNDIVNHVWVEEVCGEKWSAENYSTDEDGNKLWRVECRPSKSGSLSLLANSEYSGEAGVALKFLFVTMK